MKLMSTKQPFHLRWAYQNCVCAFLEKPYNDPAFRSVAASLYQRHLSMPHHQNVHLHGEDFFNAIALQRDPSDLLTVLRTQFTVKQDEEQLRVALRKIVAQSSFGIDLTHPLTRHTFDALRKLVDFDAMVGRVYLSIWSTQ